MNKYLKGLFLGIDSDSNEINNEIEFNKGDYILVRFASKTRLVYFVAHIDVVREEDVDVTVQT